MSFAELIAAADEAGAKTLEAVIGVAATQAPDAEEGISYGVAALLYRKRPLIGIGTNAKGYSLFPFSPAVVAAVAADLDGFRLSKGAIGFSSSQPIPDAVLTRIIQLRLAELEPRSR